MQSLPYLVTEGVTAIRIVREDVLRMLRRL